MIDHENLGTVELIRFTDEDRATLREAAELLLEEDGEERAYLAGRLHGLAGRVSTDLGSPN